MPRLRQLGTKAPNDRASLPKLLACVVEAEHRQRGHLKSKLKQLFRASTNGTMMPSWIRRFAQRPAAVTAPAVRSKPQIIKISALVVGVFFGAVTMAQSSAKKCIDQCACETIQPRGRCGV